MIGNMQPYMDFAPMDVTRLDRCHMYIATEPNICSGRYKKGIKDRVLLYHVYA